MTRPLPDATDPEFAPFWEGANRQELRLIHCSECDAPRWPPRPICGSCRSFDYEWRVIAPQGRLYTWTVVGHQTTPDIPVPYVVGIVAVRTDPAVRLLGQIVCEDPDQLRIDMSMIAQFERINDSVTLVNWAPQPLDSSSDPGTVSYFRVLDELQW